MKTAAALLTSLAIPFLLTGCLAATGEQDDGQNTDSEPVALAPEAVKAPEAPATQGGGNDFQINLFPNLLYNPAFESADLASGYIDHSNTCQLPQFAGWGTAALDWPATSNDPVWGAIATWLRTDVVHTAGGKSLLVSATTGGNGFGQASGIAQQFWTQPSPYTFNDSLRFGVWVYTVAGQVVIGLGSGLTGYVNKTSTKTGQWEYIETCGNASNTVALIYALNGPAVFYVDDAVVIATASPVTGKVCTVP
jgi:hypothetical protein